MVNANEVAGKVSKALISNPSLLDRFKSHPHESIENISGVSGLSAKETGSILSILLSGSDKGGGMLGSLADSLLSGKETKSGDKNLVGELISKAVGKKDSSDLMSTAISVILGQAAGSSSKPSSTSSKPSSSKPSSSKPSSSKPSSSKPSSSKPSSSKTSSSKTSSKNSQNDSSSDLLGTLSNILGSLSDGKKK